MAAFGPPTLSQAARRPLMPTAPRGTGGFSTTFTSTHRTSAHGASPEPSPTLSVSHPPCPLACPLAGHALTCARGPSGSRHVAKIHAGGRGPPSSCFTSSSPMPRLEPVSSTVRARSAAMPATMAPRARCGPQVVAGEGQAWRLPPGAQPRLLGPAVTGSELPCVRAPLWYWVLFLFVFFSFPTNVRKTPLVPVNAENR